MIKIILFSLPLLPLLLVDQQLFIFIVAALSPAYIALVTDRRKDKSTGMTVTFFNLAGLALYVVPMLGKLGSDKYSINVLHFFVVFIFSAVGYFIVWFIPRLFVIYADYKNQARARTVSEKMSKIIEKWGVEVRQ